MSTAHPACLTLSQGYTLSPLLSTPPITSPLSVCVVCRSTHREPCKHGAAGSQPGCYTSPPCRRRFCSSRTRAGSSRTVPAHACKMPLPCNCSADMGESTQRLQGRATSIYHLISTTCGPVRTTTPQRLHAMPCRARSAPLCQGSSATAATCSQHLPAYHSRSLLLYKLCKRHDVCMQ